VSVRNRRRLVMRGFLIVSLIVSTGGCERLFGERIGTTGAPFVRDGSALVPVYVRNLSVLPSRGAVFLLADDPRDQDRKSLVAFSLGSDSTAASRSRVYQGANNHVDLVVLVGAAKARQLIDEISRLVRGPLRQ
jgi:hypothetical protein